MTEAEPPGSRIESSRDKPRARPLPWSDRSRSVTSRPTVDVENPGPHRSQHARRAGRGRNDSVASFLRELPLLVLVAFALAFVLRTFVVQVFYIPSSSMEPTLLVNDRILVDKVTYRFRDLRRGEIVVFEGDELNSAGHDRGPLGTALHAVGQLIGIAPANARDFVKRVVGLPGDRIRIDEDGTVYVNGVALDEPYVAAEDPRPYGPVTVPDEMLFFLGDNRPNSSDSRFDDLGFVQRDHVVGKAALAIWPPDRIHFLRTPDYPPIPNASLEPAALAPAAESQAPRRSFAPAA